jgi:hypothetical protein
LSITFFTLCKLQGPYLCCPKGAGVNIDNISSSMYVFIRYVGRALLYVRRFVRRDLLVMIPTTQIQNCTSGVTDQLRRIQYCKSRASFPELFIWIINAQHHLSPPTISHHCHASMQS